MRAATTRRFLFLAILAPFAVARCQCDEVLGGLPTPQIDVKDDQGNSHREATPWLKVDLGDADSGQEKSATLTITNVGTGLLDINTMCLVAAADAESAKSAPCIIGQQVAFQLTSIVGERIKPEDSREFTVTFAPFVGGPAQIFVQITSTAEKEPVVAVELVGRGTDGRLCADNGLYDFGDVAIGVTEPGQVTLTNCGVKPVTIESFAFAQNPDSAFTFTAQGGDPVGRTLNEGEVIVLDLSFTPQQPGPYRDTRAGDIRVTTAAPFAAQYDLILVGNGIVPPACRINVVPELLNFNAVASGTQQTRQVIVQSVGQCGCSVEGISDPDPADTGFTLGALPQFPVVLRGTVGCEDDPAGAAAAPNNLAVDVIYTSPVRDVPQVDRASFVVTTSDLAEPAQTVQLEANGGGEPFCQLRVEPIYTQQIGFNVTTGRYGLVEFGRTSVHTTKRVPVTVTSIGNDTCTISELRYDDEDNTLANEFSFENEDGSPAIPSAGFTLDPGDTRIFFAVFSPTRLPEGGLIPSFQSGYSGSVPPGEEGDDPFAWAFFCGGQFAGPNNSCNGVRFETNDTTTDVSDSGQDPGVFSVGFSGSPVKPDVDVIPPELDFGLVTLDCGSPRQRTTMYNNGGADLLVDEPFIDPVQNAAAPTFVVEGTTNPTGAWPYAVPPGGSLSIEVRYYARTLAVETANLIVPTIEGDQQGPPVTVPLRGEGTTETSATDIFDQFSDPKVDVLWVIDDSGSMSPFQDQLAQNFNQFFVASNIVNADYHIAVTTTLWADDTCLSAPPTCTTSADCGQGGQCAFGVCTAGTAANTCDDHEMAGYYTACNPGNGHYISTTTTDPEADFTCNVRVSDPANVNPDRPASDSAEGGLRAAMKFLSEPNISDPNINGGFLRDDAKLHVIFVEDEPEQSKGGVDQYIDFFKNVKGFRNEGLVAVSAIAAPPNGCDYQGTILQDDRYKAVVDEMNGRFQEICNPDWTSMMSQLGLDSLGLRVEFFLSRAAEEATIQVCVRQNGAGDPTCVAQPKTSEGAPNGWFYDGVTNSVVFNAGSVPQRGSRVEISYGTFCF